VCPSSTRIDNIPPNYPICKQAKHRLEQTVDARGRSLHIVDLPLQQQISHINLYIANGVVIVPVAGDPRQDDEQLGILRNLFPGRKVAGIGAVALFEAGGGAHCITQQIPGGRRA
jgi:agmatine deiminase